MDLPTVSRLTAIAAAAAVVLVSLPGVALAGSSQPAAARQPDLQVRAVASHGPGAAAVGLAATPLRRGPNNTPSRLPSAGTKTGAFSPLTSVSASLDRQGLVASRNTPSDSTGAIGPVHYIEMVNSQIGLFDRSLASISTMNLGTFIGAAIGGAVGDPQIQWDPLAARWLYVSLELYSGDDKLAFGWSKGGDANTLTLANIDWCNFHIDTTTNLHDYPKLGHDANFILIGSDVFANGANFATASIWAIPKPAAGDMSCTAPTATEFGTAAKPLKNVPPDTASLIFTPVPGNVADNASTAYIAAIDPGFVLALHVSPTAVGACATPPCLVWDGEIAISPWNLPPAGADFQVPQPAGNPNVDALDGRLTQAVQLSDPAAAGAEALWTQHTAQDSSGRTVVTWYELIPSVCASTICGSSAKRQEGAIGNPNLYVFNGAISPTSNGDAAVIHYNTSSTTTFIDSRAQSRSAADPLNTMSGEIVLRSSTVADTDFSCSTQGGPPCRWGDYAGASPDPASCSLVWGSTMLSGDVASGGAPTWVTQNFALRENTPSPAPCCRVRSGVSTQQYTLAGSDGKTWSDVDPTRLQLAAAPCADSTGHITANADLFTSTAGVNQDIGIFVDVDGLASATPLVWKESGGFNGTFSPNAAYAQAEFPMPAGHVYTVRLKWKANKSTGGTIFAGAGPLSGGGYSPSRLTLELFPTAPGFASTTTQPKNTGSDGVTWTPIPAISALSLAPATDSRVVLGGNADLFTDTAGFNQDLGITLNGALVAWKESGGFNGTFSPNAAFVQVTAALIGGQSYTAQLVWKTNRAAPLSASIYAGAGPLPGTTMSFSPTALTAFLLPNGTNPYDTVSTQQHSLTNSDGSTWTDLGVQALVNPAISATAIVSANVDLWTANAGFNQDVGIFVSDNGGLFQLIGWKESGGFGGTFSPNAAFAESVYTMTGGHSYVFALKWKTNRTAVGTGAIIYAGAGPIAGVFSPTRLLIDIAS